MFPARSYTKPAELGTAWASSANGDSSGRPCCADGPTFRLTLRAARPVGAVGPGSGRSQLATTASKVTAARHDDVVRLPVLGDCQVTFIGESSGRRSVTTAATCLARVAWCRRRRGRRRERQRERERERERARSRPAVPLRARENVVSLADRGGQQRQHHSMAFSAVRGSGRDDLQPSRCRARTDRLVSSSTRVITSTYVALHRGTAAISRATTSRGTFARASSLVKRHVSHGAESLWPV
jgi:hypothetical protein